MRRHWDKSRPPSGAFTLNKDSLQAVGLYAWWPLAGFMRNYVPSPAPGITFTGTGRSYGKDGQGTVTFNGTSDGGFAAFDLSAFSRLSVAMRLNWTTFANDDDMALEFGSPTNANNGFALLPNDSSTSAVRVYMGATGFSNAWTFPRPSNGVERAYYLTYDRTQNQGTAAWLDGVSQVMTVTGTPVTLADNFSNSSLFVMCRNSASLFGAGALSDLRIYTDVPPAALKDWQRSADRAREFSDPSKKYELWYPLRSPKWFSAGAAVGGGFQPAWARNSNVMIGVPT